MPLLEVEKGVSIWYEDWGVEGYDVGPVDPHEPVAGECLHHQFDAQEGHQRFSLLEVDADVLAHGFHVKDVLGDYLDILVVGAHEEVLIGGEFFVVFIFCRFPFMVLFHFERCL